MIVSKMSKILGQASNEALPQYNNDLEEYKKIAEDISKDKESPHPIISEHPNNDSKENL